jgi:hypothetical protein
MMGQGCRALDLYLGRGRKIWWNPQPRISQRRWPTVADANDPVGKNSERGRVPPAKDSTRATRRRVRPNVVARMSSVQPECKCASETGHKGPLVGSGARGEIGGPCDEIWHMGQNGGHKPAEDFLFFVFPFYLSKFTYSNQIQISV